MADAFRFNFYIDSEHRFLVIRPIGNMPGPDMAARVIEAYRSVEAPWTYNRIVDLRRHTGYVTKEDRALIATAWAEMTAGVSYRAHVAMVVREAYEKLRLPEISEQFPHETICYFLDYHEAVGWLLSLEKERYLEDLGDVTPRAARADKVDFH